VEVIVWQGFHGTLLLRVVKEALVKKVGPAGSVVRWVLNTAGVQRIVTSFVLNVIVVVVRVKLEHVLAGRPTMMFAPFIMIIGTGVVIVIEKLGIGMALRKNA
jgi:hypothetical protein